MDLIKLCYFRFKFKHSKYSAIVLFLTFSEAEVRIRVHSTRQTTKNTKDCKKTGTIRAELNYRLEKNGQNGMIHRL